MSIENSAFHKSVATTPGEHIQHLNLNSLTAGDNNTQPHVMLAAGDPYFDGSGPLRSANYFQQRAVLREIERMRKAALLKPAGPSEPELIVTPENDD
jgi:hypothetical protein